jgi:hypothetical protein
VGVDALVLPLVTLEGGEGLREVRDVGVGALEAFTAERQRLLWVVFALARPPPCVLYDPGVRLGTHVVAVVLDGLAAWA